MRRRLPVGAFLVLVVLGLTSTVRSEVTLSIEPERATIGDPISVRLEIESSEENPPQREQLGPQLGSFSVLDEQWSVTASENGPVWVWTATIATYETGRQEFPALTIPPASGDAPAWATDPFTIDVVSVLEPSDSETEEVEIADLKGPASVSANLRTVWLAGIVLVVLLGLAGLLWWLNRRYAARLAAVPAIEDPFARIAPHEWAFAQLRKLLDEEGRASSDRFYEKLAWILKRYLGGRYRTDLLELTTDEVRPALEQAGTPGTALTRITPVLSDCDVVKFAKHEPSESDRKQVVERVYGIIDQTKPVERPAENDDQVGAA